MSLREDVISSAVSFLTNADVQSSPLTKRISFLESKGLTQEEIQEALRRTQNPQAAAVSTNPAPGTPGAGLVPSYTSGWPQRPPPLLPQRDWRDWFIMGIVSGGLALGIYTVAKLYILPLITPPTPSEIESDKELVTQKFDEISKLLTSVQEENIALKEAQQEQRRLIQEKLQDVENVVEELRGEKEQREVETKSWKLDLEEIRDLIPKALEKYKSTQTSSLQDLHNELKSLKALLASRTGRSSTPSLPAGPSISAANSSVVPSNGDSPIPIGTTGITTPSGAPKKPWEGVPLGTKAGIPAWQLNRGGGNNVGKQDEGDDDDKMRDVGILNTN